MAPAAGDIQFFIDTEPVAKPLSGKIKYRSAAVAPIGSATAPAAVDEPSAPPQIYRSEIPLNPLPSSAAETSTTTDYFSLEVEVEVDDKDDTDTPARTPVASPVATPTKQQERTLEGSWFRTDCRFRSPMLQLHKEILDFCDFLSPTLDEREARHNAIDAVFDVIKFIWPHCKAEVFGSFRTGLYLPTSDIDVVIMESRISRPQLGLQALSRALSQRGIAKKIQVIARARVPIIKFVEKKSGFSFDISFDVDNGPKAADFIKDAVTKWPPLRPLCLILKIFLQQRELNEVYTGGIGSYALLTMLIAMLQNYHSGQSSPEHNLGVLLVQFFDLYGRKLNTVDVGVSCDRGGTFYLKTMKGFTTKSKSVIISIQDPQTPENDIGKSSFNYFQVRSAFSMAFTTLTNAKAIMNLGPNRSILGTIIRPDAELLERKGGTNGDVTFHKLLPGAGDPLPDQNGGHGDMYCNWQFGDDDDEPLPRGYAISGDAEAGSSGKKRKKPGEKRSSKKAKKNADIGSAGPEQNGSKKEEKEKKDKKDKKDKHGKKLRWRLRQHNSS